MANEDNITRKQEPPKKQEGPGVQKNDKGPEGRIQTTPVQAYGKSDTPPALASNAGDTADKAPACAPFVPPANPGGVPSGDMITPVKLWQPDSELKGNVKSYVPEQGCEPTERAFLVALRTNQPPLKLQANDPAEFTSYLNTTSLAWVNCRVKDLETDAAGVAVSLGFGANLVESLLKNRHSGYEDQESILGHDASCN